MTRALRALLLMVCSTVSAQPVAPGDDLGEQLGGLAADRRFGLDGAPAGAVGVVPPAPDAPGAHWLVEYDGNATPTRWHRFEVVVDSESADGASAQRSLPLLIDASPPTAAIRLTPAVRSESGATVVGPEVGIEVEASDPSGGVAVILLVDGQPLATDVRWSEGRLDGSYQLSLRVSDALGNAGERGTTEVVLDSTPPTVEWRRLDPINAVAADVFDGKRARLAITATDAAAGLASLTLGDRSHDADPLTAGVIEVTVDAGSLDYVARDRVGNVGRGAIALRADADGPEFVASRNGEPVELDGATLLRSDRLQLAAEDRLAGVARACVEASIWYGSCRELPINLVGIAPGRYLLEFRAADRLGNRSYRRLSMQVLP